MRNRITGTDGIARQDLTFDIEAALALLLILFLSQVGLIFMVLLQLLKFSSLHELIILHVSPGLLIRLEHHRVPHGQLLLQRYGTLLT